MKNRFFTYENGIVSLMALTFGVLFFDRLALNYLIPYVATDLNLNNTQIGLLAAGLSLTWAISSYATTAWSDSKDKHKMTFVVAIFVFSICSFGSGLATGFGVLLVARLIMGFAEGPVIPLAQIFVERESTQSRLGLNVGILQAVGGALFGSILAPVILIQIAEGMGWRNAFYIAGMPGLLLGLVVAIYLKPSTTKSAGIAKGGKAAIKEIMSYHNMKWGVPLACAVFGWWFAVLPFITKYFVDVQGMDTSLMQATMGMLGIAMLISSIALPGLSDKFGRRPILLVASVLGICYPFAIFFLVGSAVHLPAMLISYVFVGAIPMVAAIVPSEAVPERLKAKAIGFTTGVAEIVGGVLIPGISGGLSDAIHESAFLWVAAALAVLALFFASRLQAKPVVL